MLTLTREVTRCFSKSYLLLYPCRISNTASLSMTPLSPCHTPVIKSNDSTASIFPFAALNARYKLPQHAMLASMAKRVGYWVGNCLSLEPRIYLGDVFSFWISLDAFVVLSGAVLTSYVGISGLMARMAKDRCLPQFMLAKVSLTSLTSTFLSKHRVRSPICTG